jgi:galactose-1-phosphate uridylyltransferase
MRGSILEKRQTKRKKRQKRILKERNVGKGGKKIVKCPFCIDNREIPVDKNKIEEHLIVVKDLNQHFHVHGPVNNTELIKEFILKIGEEAGIEIEDEE